MMQKVWEFLRTLFGYKAITGAAVIKIVQLVLPLAGVDLTDDQAHAIEAAVDAVIGILLAFGVVAAHRADPFLVK